MLTKCPHCDRVIEVAEEAPRAKCPFCLKEFESSIESDTVASGADAGRSARDTVLSAKGDQTAVVDKEQARKAKQASLGWLRSQLVDRYDILQFIASGGMGAVYKARQKNPIRTVAIKVMHASGLGSERFLKRFKREAQAVALLDHPSIVSVHEYGEVEGMPYFTMDYVEGVDLRAYVDEHELSRREICELMIKICEAVHYAHERGVIHRDLKPGNIMVEKGGRARILDFGLSHVTQQAGAKVSALTVTGDVMGTPRYMSPEQAAGETREIDERSDVYALGIILYELCVGVLPYNVDHAQGLMALQILMTTDPLRPSHLHREMPADLETILLKAVEKQKGMRYRSVKALADDLRNFIEDRPITARPATAYYRLRKYIWRNRRVLVPTMLGVVTVAFVGGLLGNRLLEALRGKEQIQARSETLEGRLMRMKNKRHDILSFVQEGRFKEAYEFARGAEFFMPDEEGIKGLAEEVRRRTLRAFKKKQRALFALMRRQEYEQAENQWADLTRSAQGLPFEDLKSEVRKACGDDFRSLCWARLGQALQEAYAVAQAKTLVETYVSHFPDSPYKSEAELRLAEVTQKPISYFLDRHVAVFRREMDAMNWSGAEAVLNSAQESLGEEGVPDKARWEETFAGLRSGLDSIIRAGTALKVRELRFLPGTRGMVRAVAFSSDGSLIASAGKGSKGKGAVNLWRCSDWTRVASFDLPERALPARGVAFTADGRLVVGCADGTIRLFNPQAGTEPQLIKAHKKAVRCLVSSADGSRIVSATYDETKVWDVKNPDDTRVLWSIAEEREPITVSLQGLLASTTQTQEGLLVKNMVNLREIEDGSFVRAIEMPVKPDQLAFSADGTLLAVGMEDRQLLVWDAEEDALISRLPDQHKDILALAFSPDGRILASGGADSDVNLWDVSSTRMVTSLRNHRGRAYAVVFCADGKLIVSGSNDNTVRVWGIPPAEAGEEGKGPEGN